MAGEILPLTMASQTNSASASLEKVANWDGKSQDIYQVLITAFEAKDYPECIKNLRAIGVDPKSYINSLDKVCLHLTLGQHAQLLTVWV